MGQHPRRLTKPLARSFAQSYKSMPRGYKLRLADLKDIDAILDILHHCFTTDLPERRDFRYYLTKAHVAIFLIVDSKDNAVGYHHLEANARTNILYLNTVALKNEHRGRGIGKALYDFQEKLARRAKFKRIRFHVSIKNRTSVRLAKSCGYEVIRTDKKYLHDGSDSYLMEKQIGTS